MTLIDREGEARTVIVPDTKKDTLEKVAKPIVDKSATIMTDGNPSYANLDDYFHGHHAVDHNKQFVRAFIIHTNFAESYHSLLKRGLIGAFHHISEKHMDSYLREFEFRWNSRKITDGERTERAIAGAKGKRLVYKRPLSPRA
jgi:transposase-like protein